MDNPIITLSLAQLALAFVPVGITLVILFRWSFATANAVYALGRMLVQLLLIGYVLAWVFGAQNGLLILLALAIMLVASSWIAMGTVKAPPAYVAGDILNRNLYRGRPDPVTDHPGGAANAALVFAPLYDSFGGHGVRQCHDRGQSGCRATIRRAGTHTELGESQVGRLPGSHDSGYQFIVCGGVGVYSRYDDRADTVRGVAVDRRSLPDHGHVYDLCFGGYFYGYFPDTVSRQVAES